MILITSLVAAYLFLGVLGLTIKSRIFFGVTTLGVSWLIFFPIADWLSVNPEIVFLFGLVVGSSAFLLKTNYFLVWGYRIYQIIMFTMAGYYAYIIGVLPAIYTVVLAVIFGGVVIYTLLRSLPKNYEGITIKSQVIHAHAFSIIGLANLVVYYLIYGIV